MMRNRIHQIKFRLNDEELEVLRKKVEDSGMSMTDFLRALVNNGNVVVLPPDLLRDIQRQVRGAGRNINQITKMAHIYGTVSAGDLRRVSAEQEKLELALRQLE